MKRKFILLSCLIASMLLIFAFGITASAEETTTEATSAPTIVASGSCGEGECLYGDEMGDNVTYVLNSDGLLTISGTGAIGDCRYGAGPWDWHSFFSYYYPYKINAVVILNGVTSIGDYAFNGCNGLTNITIPDSVTSIDNDAFSECPDLVNIEVSSGNSVYHSSANCLIETETKKLISGCKNSVIPTDGSVTSIGDSAFYGCTGLTSITIPDSVTSIVYGAFRGCTGLTSIKIGANLLSSVLSSSLYEDESGNYTLKNIIRNIEITSGEAIPDLAFSGYTNLTGVTIADSVTSIGGWAFSSCTKLTSITIPDSVTSIGDWAFNKCTGLTSITIPDSVTSIGECAFCGCTGLTSITIPDSVTSIGEYAFSGCTGLTSITIPDSVTSIGQYAFSGCTGLTSITIPDSVKSINNSAFFGCTNLSTVKIRDGFLPTLLNFKISENTTLRDTVAHIEITSGKEISNSIFSGCSKLISVKIPESVTTIADTAFLSCTSLESIEVDKNNEDYCSVDGVLYSKTMRRLYVYPACKPGTEFTVPSKVVRFSPYAFANNKHLEKFTIPDTVTIVDEHLFYNSTGLKEVILNSNIKTIGDYAFSGCSVLKKINYNANQITSLSNTVFENSGKNGQGITVTFGDNITTVPSYIFNGNSANVKNVHVGEKVSYFGSYAFYNCSAIEKVYITNIEKWLTTRFDSSSSNPLCYAKELYVNNKKFDTLKLDKTDSVSINSCAFDNFSGLKTVDIKANSVYINDYAFTGSGLKNLTLTSDNGITVRDSFENCTSLGKVSLKAGTSINIYSSAFIGCTSIKTVSLTADDTISVGNFAFNGCTSLTSVNMSDAYDNSGSIGSSAFYGCTSLNSLRIGNGITSIGSSAFKGCSSLESVIVPVSVTTINSEAFADCKKLKDIYILNAECIASDSAQNTVYKNALIHSHAGYSVEEYANRYGFDFDPIHIGVGEYFTSAKCTEPGEQYQKCKYCDEWANTSSVPALGHKTVTDKAVAATCTKTGLTEGSHCSVCNTVIKKQETVPALGHKAVTDKAVAATCIKTGLTEGSHCSVCNTVIKKQETVKALGHDFTGTVRTNADGSISYKCTRCDEYGATVKPAEKKLDEITGTKRLTQDNVVVLVAPVEMTARTVLASANGAKLVDENGKEVTNGEKPLATGMKVILGKTSVTISVAGDVDGSGDISVSDARLALRAAVKLDTLIGADFTSADVDFSGDISVSDARLILRAAVQLDDPKKAWIK